jgi:hypothetical protein
MADEGASQSTLRDNLLALPLWAPLIAFGLLAAGVGVGFTLLLVPDLSDALRTAGGQLLVVSLPVSALLVGLLGASWAQTKRIDGMIASYLRGTVGDKVHAYLIGSGSADEADPYPPLFARMERLYRMDMASFCRFRLTDGEQRKFDVLVKCNVFNYEIVLRLDLAAPPPGYRSDAPERSYNSAALEAWETVSKEPLIELVSSTLHGSLAEGYTLYVQAQSAPTGGLHVIYRLRQRLEGNFLTSPYLRRYFSEDTAIACYFFYDEALADPAVEILGGEA